MNTPRKKSTITLDDLLRLKRTERPPAEFWGEFDRELRAKQLAAIVEPRPWWAPLILVGARFARYQLPVGAAAILTLSFLTVSEYRTSDGPSAYVPELAAQAVLPVESPRGGQDVAALSPPEATAVAAMATVLLSETSAAAPIPASVADPMPRQTSPGFAIMGASFAAERGDTPSARYIAANLAAAQAAEPELGDVFARPARAVSVRQPVREPLAQISPPSESRLARLLSPALPDMAGAGEASLYSTERVARNITEDRLYDNISRISARGAGVALKF